MTTQPTGTVTFLFTDIEGSTKLAREHPAAWETSRARHHVILREAIEGNHGYVFQIIGDAFCASFQIASDALKAALDAQRALQHETWGTTPIKVRMGLHTGTAHAEGIDTVSGGYVGYTTMALTQRVMSAAHGGQVLLSLATEELVRDELPENITLRDMGEHRLKDMPQPEPIFQLIIPNLSADFPPLRALEVSPNNLPAQLTSFIGRDKELVDVKRLLTNTHLLTLIGPGGTGKTRLSLQAATDLLETFSHGVWLVELAPILDPLLVPRTTAMAIGLREEPQRPVIDMLCDYLRDKKMLIVLDNCEHLVDACAQMADRLLHASADTRILASSREALGIAGEVTYRVPSLGLPDVNHLPSVETLGQYEAVNLFIDRATSVVPTFSVTNDNAPALAQICHRLDGIPLAIELAAAKVRVLSVDQIAKRLDDRFKLLTGGSRTALERHQTLRAAIDWSYNLLPPAEQVLFRRLSVFVNGWTLEAAESVCSDASVKSDDVLELLEHLINKSIVITEVTQHPTRYRVLETMRQYANEKLVESGESDALRDKHLEYFLNLAETAAPHLIRSEQLEWLAQLDDDYENLRAALEYSLNVSQNGYAGMQMAKALAEYWDKRSYFNEAIFWLEKALDQSRSFAGTVIRANLLYQYGLIMSSIRGRWEDVQPLLVESLETFRSLGEPHRVDYAYVLVLMGYMLYFRDEYETGKAYVQEAIRIFQDTDDKWGHGWALNLFSDINSYEGNLLEACALAEKGAALYKEYGDRYGFAICIMDLGHIYLLQGNYKKAIRHYEEALGLFKEFGNKGYACQALQGLGESHRGLNEYKKAEAFYRESLSMRYEAGMASGWFIGINLSLGYTALYQSDERRAVSYFKEALTLSRDLNHKATLAHCLAGFAAVIAFRGDAEDAALLYGAMDSQFQALLAEGNRFDSLIEPVDCKELERYQALCLTQLGSTAFETAMEQGREMTLDAAIGFALAETHE